jgi:tetratricopeptide (TPR) repeat protein
MGSTVFMRVLRRLLNLERGTLVLAASLGAFGLGMIFPWYGLPPRAMEAFAADLSWVRGGQALSALGVLVVLDRLARSRGSSSRTLFWAGLGAGLLFPYGVATWSVPSGYLAVEFYGQEQRMIKHAEDNFPFVQSQWKRSILLEPTSPAQSGMPLRIRESRFFQLSCWNRVVEGLGYSNPILTFLRRGWTFYLGGCLAALLGSYLMPHVGLAGLRHDLRRLLPAFAATMAVLGLWLLAPSLVDHRLETLFARGEHRAVLRWSRVAAAIYPPFRTDADFVLRQAAAGVHGGVPDPTGNRLARGILFYQQRELDEARDCLSDVLAESPNTPLVRAYLASTLVNLGVQQFNIGRHAAAGDLFRQALAVYPQHVEALYDLMLSQVANAEFSASAQSGELLREVSSYYQLPSVALAGQSYLHSAWARYRAGDLDDAWEEFRKSHDRDAWKK